MERKEILAVILAAAVIIIVIGVLGMVRGNTEDSSVPDFDPSLLTEAPAVTEKTDIWDVIRDQQAAMTSTEPEAVVTDAVVTDDAGDAVTDENGIVLTEAPAETATPGEAESDTEPIMQDVIIDEVVPADDVPAQTAIQINLN